jgi:hypothetical protein
VVFKSASESLYILDFTLVEAKAFGPYVNREEPHLRDVLYDTTAWFTLDGGQKVPLGFSCRMLLLACSNKKTNYHKFAKHYWPRVKYVLTWSQVEVQEFLDDFQDFRPEYGYIDVPDDKIVMKNFWLFGGMA